MNVMRSIILKATIDTVQKEFSLNPPELERDNMTYDDFALIYNECMKPSEFDPLNLRKSVIDKLRKGEIKIIAYKCNYGRIITFLLSESQEQEIPWYLWARILRMFSQKNTNQISFRVFLLANTILRTFPEKGTPIKPVNINGGYTYPCKTDSIIIYKAEDATRVLIHELMHATCLDDMSKSVDDIEAETEAWAELMYIALLSQGKPYTFNNLLQRQSEYMRKQNNRIQKEHMIKPTSQEFPWRYTIGKENVWRRWGILETSDTSPFIKVNSLRLTIIPNNNLKSIFNVAETSTIL